ncbi:MAG: flavocytochrome c [Clostridia bacterium]|nr:flavocytochrome c [Clostridia bacterium]
MKRMLSMLVVLAMLLALVPAAMADTVTGTATVPGAVDAGAKDLTVTITLTDGVITDVAVTHEETPGIGSKAVDALPGAIVKANSINVDIMSSATQTSNAILAAAELALVNAGVNPEDYKAKAEDEKAEDITLDTDVVIVGAGGAGMTAAIVAAQNGLNVVVLESQPIVGGNSVKATGGMNAADTDAQDTNTFGAGGEEAAVAKTLKAAEAYADNAEITALAAAVAEQWAAYQANPNGYFDSVELMELDTMIGGKGINDPELVATLCANTDDAIDWLATVNIDLVNVGSFGGATVKRIHRPVNAEGKTVSVGSYMVPRLEAAVNGLENAIILTETTAHTIVMTDGAATGVIAVGKTGNTVTVNAKAVILASGGFGANLPMVSAYNPALDGFMTTNAAGIQGQGIEMAVAVGAATVDMDQIQIHPTVEANTASLITEGLRGDGAILVNAEGLRFIDEVGTRDVVSAAEIAQTGSYSWLIVDQKMVDASSVIAGYITKGFTTSGDTYEALAEAVGMPTEAFAATMNDWNTKVEAKADTDFGRTSFAKPLDTAPFYAIKVTAGIHHTMGGLKIDTDACVLNTEGQVIPGLFAAGEVTGGVHGANRLGGNAVADFTVFGRIAAQSVLAYIAK